MDLMEAMRARHSVRKYLPKELAPDVKAALEQEIAVCNRESGLHMQLVCDEPKAFSGKLAKYGRFEGVTNYIAVIGKKSDTRSETCGYYGERLVLFAQQLGLNTCWVALTYQKIPGVYELADDEKLVIVIAIGYGANQGTIRKSKTERAVSNVTVSSPMWFKKGVEAALLAPTAVNQQAFLLIRDGETVKAKAGMGFYANLDLGIVKYHFELGAGKENFSWE